MPAGATSVCAGPWPTLAKPWPRISDAAWKEERVSFKLFKDQYAKTADGGELEDVQDHPREREVCPGVSASRFERNPLRLCHRPAVYGSLGNPAGRPRVVGGPCRSGVVPGE